jgi:hypothetical protein
MAAKESSRIPFCLQATSGLRSQFKKELSYRFEHSPPWVCLPNRRRYLTG